MTSNGADTRQALVTGAASGIGAAFASRLAERKFGLLLVDKQHDALMAVARDIEARHGVPAKPILADLQNTADQDAVIDVIERDRLAENVATVGAFLKSALAGRKGRFASIADVRGHGLFIGVEIAKTDAAREPDMDKAVDIINRLKDRGFLTSNAGAYRNVVKIRPPLVFRQSHAEEFLVAFDATMAEVDG